MVFAKQQEVGVEVDLPVESNSLLNNNYVIIAELYGRNHELLIQYLLPLLSSQ